MKIMQEWKHVKECRRGMAFMLAVAMVAVNILAGATSVYAADPPENASGTEIVCELDADEVKAAIENVMQKHDSAAAGSEVAGDSGEQLYPLSVGVNLAPQVDGVSAELLYDASVNDVIVRVTNASSNDLTFSVKVGEKTVRQSVTVKGVSAAGGNEDGEDGGESKEDQTSGMGSTDVASPANGDSTETIGAPGLPLEIGPTDAPETDETVESTEASTTEATEITKDSTMEATEPTEANTTEATEPTEASTSGAAEPTEEETSGETEQTLEAETSEANETTSKGETSGDAELTTETSMSETPEPTETSAPTEGTTEPTGATAPTEPDPNNEVDNGITTIADGPQKKISDAGDEPEANTVDVRISGEVFGYYGVTAAAAVTLTMNGKSINFETIQAAIDAIADAGNDAGEAFITVNQDLKNVAVTAAVPFSLNLNTHTLHASPDAEAAFMLEIGDGNILIENGSIVGDSQARGAIKVTREEAVDGSVTLDGLTLSGYEVSNNSAVVSIYSNQIDRDLEVTVRQCTIEDNSGTGSALFIKAIGAYKNRTYPPLGKATIVECTIRNNQFSGTGNYGGPAYIGMKENTVKDSTFSNNNAKTVGALAIAMNVTAQIEGSTFSENSASESGALLVDEKATATVSNCRFEGNTVMVAKATTPKDDTYAGAIVTKRSSELTICNNTEIRNNHSNGANGAIFNGDTLTIEDTVITGNTAEGKGDYSTGGIRSKTSDLSVLSGAVFGNSKGDGPSDIMTKWVQVLLPASEMSGPGIGGDIYLWKNSITYSPTDWEKGIKWADFKGSEDLNLTAVKTETTKAALTITKIIEGEPEKPADISEKKFVFDITGDNGYSGTVEITGEKTSDPVYLLPGTYTITEQNASIEGYLWTAPEAKTVTITDGEPVNVEFMNTYALPGSLTIKTTVEVEGDTANEIDASGLEFSFTIKGVDNGVEARPVTIAGGGGAKLEGLLPGTYTVTENIGDSSAKLAGYVLEDPGVQTVEVIGGEAATVEITNTYKPEPKGSLHIQMVLKGDLPEKERPEEFTVIYYKRSALVPKEENYHTFTPQSGEVVWEMTEENLPVGEYCISPKGTNVDGYARTVEPKTDTAGKFLVEVKENQTTEAVITFTYTKYPVRIGSTTYESLAKAFSAVPDNEEVTDVVLLKDIELDSTVTLEEGQYVNLISDGKSPYTIKRSEGFEKCLLTVEEGAELTLGNIVFDGGSDEGLKASQSLIKVEKYAALKITDGAVLQNNDCQEELSAGLGGVPTMGYYDHNGGGVLCQGTLEMTGGKIRNCKANNGGGIMIASYDNPDDAASFEMSGGIISGNAAYYMDNKEYGYNVGAGGGVVLLNASTMKFTGGEISGNTAGVGGGISVGTECSTNYAGGIEYHLKMDGGKVDENKADGNGGGIFIAGAAFGAEIKSGEITNNECALDPVSYTVNHRPAYYGGGGIYVHGNTSKTGHLQVYNVQISDNNADIAGGGIAGCPSSSVGVYITDGGVIYGNNDDGGEKAEQEIYVVRDADSIPMVSISPTMLGGGRYDWTDETGRLMDDSELRVTLDENHSSIATYNALTEDDADVQKAVEMTHTVITGNISHSCGGGIGTNGGVSVGTPGPEDAVTSVWIKKDWEIDVKRYPESITFWLLRDGERIASANMKSASGGGSGWYLGAVEFFKGLPVTAPDGHTYEYSVEEKFNGLYDVTVVPGKTGSEAEPWSFVNTQTCSLRITKNAVGGDADAAYGFQITLTNPDGTPYTGPVKVVDDDGNELASPVFADGKASITLKSGEVLFLTGLDAGTLYSVEETEDGGAGRTSFAVTYTDCSNIQQSRTDGEGKTCEGETAYGRTDIVFRNEFVETTSVKVQKKWVIDGSDADAPDGAVITVRLLADGTATGDSLELSAETDWEGEFADLPAKDAEGRPIAYTIEEEAFDGWESQVTGDAVSGFVVTNAYFTPRTGGLSVTKTLSGDAAETDRAFRFTVTLTPAEGSVINGPFGDMVFADNQAVVELKGGETAVASGLPAGTAYSVAEDSYPEYTVTYTNENGTIADGETAEVVVNNHRTQPPENPETPTNPEPPENPETPNNPGTPPGNTPPPTPPVENITDEPTPLSSFEKFENIEDEDVPLAFLAPMTGDETPAGAAALFGLIALGMMGAFGILGLKKDEKDM